MSQFTSFSSVRIPTKESNLFTLLDDLTYEVGYEWSGEFITVHDWFQTNFASTPLIVKAFWNAWDYRWILWSVLHDYLFSKSKTLYDFQRANDIFYEAIQVTWTPRWIAIIFYLWVSVWKYYHYMKKRFV